MQVSDFLQPKEGNLLGDRCAIREPSQAMMMPASLVPIAEYPVIFNQATMEIWNACNILVWPSTLLAKPKDKTTLPRSKPLGITI